MRYIRAPSKRAYHQDLRYAPDKNQAPVVRHVRSPWSAQSDGHGLKGRTRRWKHRRCGIYGSILQLRLNSKFETCRTYGAPVNIGLFLYPTDSHCEPVGLRIFRPESGADFKLCKNLTRPFYLTI